MRTAWLPALGLFVLAPVCGEYLWGYDDSTGHPGTLVGNLIVFSPLYGAPALLIREAARRRGLGWPGILLLAAAFGVVEAGLVDQSMWSTGYRDIPYWQDMSRPTYVEPIGLSLYLALSFVGGHVVLSTGSPIALVETLTPRRRREPWLGPVLLWVVALLYLATSLLVLKDAYDTGEAAATWGQLLGCAVAALALVVAAFRVPRRSAPMVPGRVPRPLLVWAGAFAAMIGWVAIPPTRLGTVLTALIAVAAAVAVWHWSRRGDWGQPHVLALASGAVVAAGCFAFQTTPIGDVDDVEKYGHNVALLLLVVTLSVWGARRARPQMDPRPAPVPPSTMPDLLVPHRFCGPPTSGNGGWTAGALAALTDLEPTVGVAVSLLAPPPLDTPMSVETVDGATDLAVDGAPVARATAAAAAPELAIEPVPIAEARAAQALYVGHHTHPFPTCFVCGPERADGLRIFPGPVAAQDGLTRVAGTWTADETIADDLVAATWAALDCVGGWAGGLEERMMVLARMTAWVDVLPEIGAEHVVLGLGRGTEGRKTHTSAALLDPDGRVVGRAEHLWIAVDAATFGLPRM